MRSEILVSPLGDIGLVAWDSIERVWVVMEMVEVELSDDDWTLLLEARKRESE
jgi:hypothetical protein